MTPETEALVRSATDWADVPFVPEVTLRTAAEPFSLWETSERDAPPFWAFPWAGGQGLARYVLDHPETVAGRNVLDVASGSGLVAIAAAKAGAQTVIAGDIDENALAAIAINAAANNTPQVIARPVDLAIDLAALGADMSAAPDAARDAGSTEGAGSVPGAGSVAGGGFVAGAGSVAGAGRIPDVVLAADVFYQRELAALALTFLKAARQSGATVLVADPSRAFVPRPDLIPVLTYEIPVLQVLEDTSVKPVTIYTLP